jgi:hypothetical protein
MTDAPPAADPSIEPGELGAFALEHVATRMQSRIDGVTEAGGETIGIGLPFARTIVHACQQGGFPRTITPEIAEVLSLPNFRTGPLAHLYRAAGHDIRPRFEDEQAFVLHRFLLLALEHGDDWRRHADADIQAAQAKRRALEAGAPSA